MSTDRERFLAVLLTGPLLRADAIVLPTGDGTARIPAVVELFKGHRGECQIVVTGGLDNPPHSLKASAIAKKIIGLGVAPSRVTIDDEAMHTQQQAENVITAAVDRKWKTLLLVASAYHLPRVFLTFLKTLEDRGLKQEIRMVPVPASQAPWFQSPEGMMVTRFGLLDDEFQKIATYGEQGHVAGYENGIDYLKSWESR